MTEIRFAFGKKGITVALPGGPKYELIESRTASAVAEATSALDAALDHPVAGPSLLELARGKKTAAISVCDITRPAPNQLTLPPLLRRLHEAGIAMVHGEVIQTRKAGTLTGSPELTLKLVSLDLGGRSYPLYTYQFRVQGTSKTKPTEAKVKGGAVVGAIVGGVFSGSAKGETTAVGKLAGMGTGAALGAGVGAMASAATPGPVLSIPAESQMEFQLASPISVQTVSAKEAARLAEGLRPGGPVLYVRGATP